MNARTWFVRAALAAAGAVLAATAYGEAPQGSTAECKDGSYTSAPSKRGACSGHGGIKEWYAKDAKAPAAPAPATKSAPTTSAPPATPAKSASKSTAMPSAAAPGGGAGKVWVNSASKVYHCQGDKWYGKTKKGEYMSEADAKAAGNHPDHGKACS